MSKSFDFTNDIRDVNEAFDTLLSEFPVLLQIVLQGSTNDLIGAGLIGQGTPPSVLSTFITGEVSNTKYEWINDQLTPIFSDITSINGNGDGTLFDVTDGSRFQAGMLVRIESTVGASKSEVIKITGVSSNQLTVTRDYGGSTGVTLIVGDVFRLTSQPLEQNTDAGEAIKHEGTAAFNFTEILDEHAAVSRTAQQTNTYDKYSQITSQGKAALIRLARKISGAMYHGLQVAPSAGIPSSMGGLRQLITGNVESSGGAISQTKLDDVFEDIASNGGKSQNYLIVGHPTQTRKISALNTGGTNPVVFKQDVVGQRLGNFVSNYVSDLPLMEGAMSAGILSDWDMVKDELLILDMNRIRLKSMKGIGALNAANNGQDGFKERYLGELTLEVKNGGEAHGKVTGLNL